MKLSQIKSRSLVLFSLVAAVSVFVGVLAGRMVHLEGVRSSATSANITVENNNQPVSQEQSESMQIITKTSTVTVKNSDAEYGYTLTAKLGQNTLTNSTVSIGSTGSSECTVSEPCELNTTTPTTILITDDDAATSASGDTTSWVVYIAVPANVDIGNYVVDVVYDEVANENPGPPDVGAMQDLTNAACPTERSIAYDTRNGQYYYVRKIGSLCWMESNLRYATGLYTDPPGGDTDYTNTNPVGGFYGYLYHSSAVISACPAGWRLPVGGSTGGEFATLNNVVNGGLENTDEGWRTNFLAVYSGLDVSSSGDFSSQGSGGYMWTSTEQGYWRYWFVDYSSMSVRLGIVSGEYNAFAIRCVR